MLAKHARVHFFDYLTPEHFFGFFFRRGDANEMETAAHMNFV